MSESGIPLADCRIPFEAAEYTWLMLDGAAEEVTVKQVQRHLRALAREWRLAIQDFKSLTEAGEAPAILLVGVISPGMRIMGEQAMVTVVRHTNNSALQCEDDRSPRPEYRNYLSFSTPMAVLVG